MNAGDFSAWENGVSTAKFTRKPVIADLSVVQFRRGCIRIFWKTNMESEQWEEGDSQEKTATRLLRGYQFPSRTSARGIPQNKKHEIETKLCPLMPAGRRTFGLLYLSMKIHEI